MNENKTAGKSLRPGNETQKSKNKEITKRSTVRAMTAPISERQIRKEISLMKKLRSELSAAKSLMELDPLFDENLLSKKIELIKELLVKPESSMSSSHSAATDKPTAPLSRFTGELPPVSGQPTISSLKKVQLTANSSLAPAMQLAVAKRTMGNNPIKLSSTEPDEIAVVGVVSDLSAWMDISDVFHGQIVGMNRDGHHIVTGRAPLHQIENIQRNQAVVSLQPSQPMLPTLSNTTTAMGVTKNQLASRGKDNGGAGVVIGIIDFGCDFAHPNFLNEDGTTRLISLWNQSDSHAPNGLTQYGRTYTNKEINQALATADPYATLRYEPSAKSHGTHVMDIAAGNGRRTGQAGVAPLAEIIFVDVAATDIPYQGPQTALYHFGDSVQILEAIKFVFDQAGDKPCVVNLSLGTNGGPHDGTSMVEQGIDALVREKENRAVVIAASNSNGAGIHIDGEVEQSRSTSIEWNIYTRGGGEVEIWYEPPCELEATLIAPDGSVALTLPPNSSVSLDFNGQIAIFGSSRLNEPTNGSNVICIWVAPGLDEGKWELRLTSSNGQGAHYHAWIERCDGAQSSFTNATESHTLGSISTGHDSIVVGSFNANNGKHPISSFSSAGPTRDCRQKPDISAPGEHVHAAYGRDHSAVLRMSGTSMAAPAVAGMAALMMADAKLNNIAMDASEIRNKIVSHCNPSPASPGSWHPRYGMGLSSGKSI